MPPNPNALWLHIVPILKVLPHSFLNLLVLAFEMNKYIDFNFLHYLYLTELKFLWLSLVSIGFYTPSFSHKYIDDIDVSPKLQFKMKRKVSRNYHSETPERPANAPIPKYIPAYLQMTPVNSALRCHSKGRGSLYDGIVGICCHFCR